MKPEKRRCGICKKRKTIHFFFPSEWAKPEDYKRRCSACLHPLAKVWHRNQRGRPTNRLLGSDVWRHTNGWFYPKAIFPRAAARSQAPGQRSSSISTRQSAGTESGRQKLFPHSHGDK